MRQLILIEAPSNLGLKEPMPGVEPGVKFFPAAMQKERLAENAGIQKRILAEPPVYDGLTDKETGVKNAAKIIEYSKKLADSIETQLKENILAVVIGGDCSILIGAALALKRNGSYGLFYLDGHTDYVLPQQSGSGGAAGMDLAMITGNGPVKFTNMQNLRPYIKEENVFCCGNRDISEEWYVDAIEQSDINYYDLSDMRSRGLKELASDFLTITASKDLDGFWIHFDVDVLNDEIMPCVDSRQEDGLSYKELKEILLPLLESPLCAGVNITIFDPTLDVDGKYGKQLAAELAGILKQVKAD